MKWDTTADQLQVSNPEHIKQWLKNDVIQITDPLRNNIAIDISPLMQKALSAVFPQDGVLLNAGSTGDITIACNKSLPRFIKQSGLFQRRRETQFHRDRGLWIGTGGEQQQRCAWFALRQAQEGEPRTTPKHLQNRHSAINPPSSW